MAGFDNSILNCPNVDFRGVQPVVGQVTANGQLLIGSAVFPNIRVGTLKSNDGSVTITSGAGSIDLKVASSGGSTNITPNDGIPVTPVAGSITVVGQTAISTNVIYTTSTGNQVNIEDRTYLSQYVVDPSATAGLKGTYQTIQSAINAANADGTGATGAVIYLRTQSNAENLTVAVGQKLTFVGIPDINSLSPVVLNGNSDFGTSVLVNIQILGTITVSNNITFQSCKVGADLSVGVYSEIYFYNCIISGNLTDTAGSLIVCYSCNFLSGIFSTAGGFIFGNFCTNPTFDADAGYVYVGNCYEALITGTGANLTDINNSSIRDTITITGNVYYSTICAGTTFIATQFFSGATNILINPSSQGNVLQAVRSAVNYVASNYDYYIGITNTAAARAVTLPSSCNLNQSFIIKDESLACSTNNITVAAGGTLIDGAASQVINLNGGSMTVVFDGTNYFLI